MDLESVKKTLESDPNDPNSIDISSLPPKFFNEFILTGLRIDLIEPGRVLCSLTVPACFRNDRKYLPSGMIASLVDMVGSAALFAGGLPTCGVSLEISVSNMHAAFVGEEIEFDAKVLQAGKGKSVAVVSVQVRKKSTGKIIAQGRHTKYIAMPSKL